MFRPWQTAVAFTLCLVIVLTALAWVSVTVLRLEREQVTAQEQAALEENVRLALWRMDSAIAPLLAYENMRPLSDYHEIMLPLASHPSQSADQVRGSLAASPPLAQPAGDVLLYFQILPSGAVSSPQVPPAAAKSNTAAETSASVAEQKVVEERLKRLQGIVDPADLLASLPAGGAAAWSGVVAADRQVDRDGEASLGAEPQLQQRAAENNVQSQLVKNSSEFRARSQQNWKNREFNNNGLQVRIPDAPVPAGNAVVGVMTPLWRFGELLLLRRVTQGDQTYIQGCWLDWPALRASLLEGVGDLLPRAELAPVPSPTADDRSRLMAALPARLVPGTIDIVAPQEVSPLGLSLVMAWSCVFLAVAAVAALVRGVVALSERRSAFVSAVTHELRTPLTTFRMYAEMLADGMVTDPESRRQYLDTLRIEAGRLTHLVENVLAYAQLERGSARGQPEVVPLADLVPRVAGRLRDRAALAEMELVVDSDVLAANDCVHTDVAAVEQVLLNLVDNACKYAASATDRRVHLQIESLAGQVLLRVRDHGPGLAQAARRRLFQPFSKSAVEAAHSAPGVGLGLALSRRLARAMGGELRLDTNGVQAVGACFTLVLPKAVA